jgi:hypothetical protein
VRKMSHFLFSGKGASFFFACFDHVVSFKLGPLLWGLGACTLRAQWTSTSAVRRLRSLIG